MDKDTRNWISSTRSEIDNKIRDLHQIAFHKGEKASEAKLEQVKLLLVTLTTIYEGQL